MFCKFNGGAPAPPPTKEKEGDSMPTKLALPLLVVLLYKPGDFGGYWDYAADGLAWENGRQLATASATVGDTTVDLAYTYDINGLRTSKTITRTVETAYHEYIYASGKLLREVITTTDAEGNTTTETLDFTYDASGSPFSLTYNGTTYYYVVNLQGDVIWLVSGTGATVAEYEYDPYGRVISGTGTMAEVNPLRYRGYCYDAESEFYYLQSRYYDPVVCRFVNADSYTSTGQGFLGHNMFAYCGNCPTNRVDAAGYAWWGQCTITIYEGQWLHDPSRPSQTSVDLKKQAKEILANEKYSPETWPSLSADQQTELLNSLIGELANMFGVATPELTLEWMLEGSYGMQGGNTITLNSDYLGDAAILGYTVHEMYHIYQWNVMNNLIEHEEPISTVSVWKHNYTPKGLYSTQQETYYNSPIEIGAHWFAGQIHLEWHDASRWPGYLQ